MPEQVVRTKTRARYTHTNAQGVRIDRRTITMKFRGNGQLVRLPNFAIAEKLYAAGDQIFVEVWSAKPLPKDLPLVFQFQAQRARDSDSGSGG